jgi:hypothetical protein
MTAFPSHHGIHTGSQERASWVKFAACAQATAQVQAGASRLPFAIGGCPQQAPREHAKQRHRDCRASQQITPESREHLAAFNPGQGDCRFSAVSDNEFDQGSEVTPGAA